MPRHTIALPVALVAAACTDLGRKHGSTREIAPAAAPRTPAGV